MGETTMAGRLEAYSVVAYNTAKLSENKMHDDQVARRFGFSGGLVPGVDVMAYMIPPASQEMGPGVSGTRVDRGAFRQAGL
jgi:hypothetical protein